MIDRQPGGRDDVAETILDAADRLFHHYGYSKTTVDDVAREAGIGKGTIYLHFRSKEEVALSCIERLNKRLQERLRAIARCKSPAAERVGKILVMRVMFRLDVSKGYAQSQDELYAALRPRLQALRETNYEAEAEILSEVLVEGRMRGEFDAPEALPAARTLILAMNALLPYSLSPKLHGQRAQVEESAERLVGMLLTGLLARGAEASPAAPEPSRLRETAAVESVL